MNLLEIWCHIEIAWSDFRWYSSWVSDIGVIIQYSNEPCALIVTETMFLSHETRLDKAHCNPKVPSLLISKVVPLPRLLWLYQLLQRFKLKCQVMILCSSLMEVMVFVEVVVMDFVVVAYMVVELEFNVRFAIRLDMMLVYAIIVTLLSLIPQISGGIQLHTSCLNLLTQMLGHLLHLLILSTITGMHLLMLLLPSVHPLMAPLQDHQHTITLHSLIEHLNHILLELSPVPILQHPHNGTLTLELHIMWHIVDRFLDNISTSGSNQVLHGNRQGLPITSIGTTVFQSSHKLHTTLKLNNLLLVLQITKNLISVSQFARDNNMYFEFHPYFFLVKS